MSNFCSNSGKKVTLQIRSLIWNPNFEDSGAYHWGPRWPSPPSSLRGRWEWTSGWAGPRPGWCPPTDTDRAARRSCVRRTLRTAAWWRPLWCPGRCSTRWSCESGWRSFRDSLREQPQNRQTRPEKIEEAMTKVEWTWREKKRRKEQNHKKIKMGGDPDERKKYLQVI